MTDAELAEFLGFKPADDQVKVAKFIIELSPETRATYELLARTALELNLWTAGLGPKPAGVIVCRERKRGG